MGTAWIAIVGTVVGAATSFLFQRLTQRRTERFTRDEQLRARRIDAYSDFAEKVMDWRRAHMTRLRKRLDTGPDVDDYEPLRTESHVLRARSWAAFYKVKLLCGDPALEQLALAAIEATHQMSEADDRATLDALGESVRARLDDFLELASEQAVGRALPKK
ncbi:hypothetical protein ACQPXM_10520 [Kribbella sp. CA-253562]|uniref:hypothetical protein n=1 Tax=Kribbella sp. CA-253562 TaxID=3239942 RepID=UPI003D94D17E